MVAILVTETSSALLLGHMECIQCIIAIGQILIVGVAVGSYIQTGFVMDTCPRDLIGYACF